MSGKRKMKMKLKRQRQLFGELYQVLGALDAPAHVLDKVSAAANGERIDGKSLLPFKMAELIKENKSC